MAEQTYEFKEGHYPDFEFPVIDSKTRKPLDLVAYDWVIFVMVAKDWTVKINEPWSIVDSPNWIIKYTFQTWETDTQWTYKAYFSLTKAGVKKISAPTKYFTVEIIEDLID